MKTKKQFLLKNYISTSLLNMEKNDPAIRELLSDAISEKELIRYIEHRQVFDPVALPTYNLEQKDATEILELINNDRAVLSYFFENFTNWKIDYCPREVQDTLHELSLNGHELWNKHVSHWDQKDFDIYHSILMIHNRACKAYGIFLSSVKAEDVQQADSLPVQFYLSYEQAELVLNRMVEIGKFEMEDLHILKMIVAV